MRWCPNPRLNMKWRRLPIIKSGAIHHVLVAGPYPTTRTSIGTTPSYSVVLVILQVKCKEMNVLVAGELVDVNGPGRLGGYAALVALHIDL